MDPDDERVRALLAKAGEQPGPPLGLTSDAIVRRGRRIRLIRWGSAVAGVAVVIAGVTVSLLLVTAKPVPPASPPHLPSATPVTTTTVDVTTTTWTTAETTSSP
ncbi:hypothetical protein [Kutzneria buriramensis]|uniref:Uncharacterized protein n=1 Tax=Kutzneria buriramensis TaxID=1045776 RepID=A0A3E0I532_9PSEU|nr:hypothetical protein [Kutzneria buriramensis]REH53868.1 hypothetical protein BCF44_10289 [Kutzneria buriramensis]